MSIDEIKALAPTTGGNCLGVSQRTAVVQHFNVCPGSAERPRGGRAQHPRAASDQDIAYVAASGLLPCTSGTPTFPHPPAFPVQQHRSCGSHSARTCAISRIRSRNAVLGSSLLIAEGGDRNPRHTTGTPLKLAQGNVLPLLEDNAKFLQLYPTKAQLTSGPLA